MGVEYVHMSDRPLSDAVVVQRLHPHEDAVHLQECLCEHIVVLTVQPLMETDAMLACEEAGVEHLPPYRSGQ